MTKYIKTKSIDAEQFDQAGWYAGLVDATAGAISKSDYEKRRRKYCNQTKIYDNHHDSQTYLQTPKGGLLLNDGDYIVDHFNADRYVIKQDAFNQLYMELPSVSTEIAQMIEFYHQQDDEKGLVYMIIALMYSYQLGVPAITRRVANALGDTPEREKGIPNIVEAYLHGYQIAAI